MEDQLPSGAHDDVIQVTRPLLGTPMNNRPLRHSMSDTWIFSSASPIMDHCSLTPSPSFFSSPLYSSPPLPHPQVTSPHLPHHQVTSPHLPHHQVTSPHLPHHQVTSPHLPHHQVTSPHFAQPQVTSPHLPHHQVTSPHLPHHQVTSPHLPHHQVTSPHFAQPQVTSPHLPHHQMTSPHLPHHQVTSSHLPHHQVTSPHLLHHQVTSPHLPHHQVTSPHLPHHQVTSPHLLHHQVTSPHLPHPQVTSPHLLHPQVNSPHLPHHQVTSSHLPHPQVTSPHLLHPQVNSPHVLPPPQELFSHPPVPGLEDPEWSRCEPLSEPPCLPGEDGFSFQNQSSVHLQGLQSSHQLYNTHTHFDFNPPGPGQDPWGPVEQTQPQLYCSLLGYQSVGAPQGGWSSMEDITNTQFLHTAPQPFSSPTTPGPSPQYPQAPTVPVPGPQHRMDRPSLDDLMVSYQDLQQETRFLPSRAQLLQDLTDLLSPTGGLEEELRLSQWKEDTRGPDADFTRMKLTEPERSTKVLESRLLCSVCRRSFRSLPALNGHMRSHSGFRSTSCLKKAPPAHTKVIPSSTSVHSRGAAMVRRRGQRRCSTGRPALYLSLMRRHEEEEEEEEEEGEEEEGWAVRGGGVSDERHYTPPPMLCPVRAGPGLFCSLTTRGRQRVQRVRLHNGRDEPAGVQTACCQPGMAKLRINVGQDFQADVPPMWSRERACSDSHNALLLWTPWEELEHPVNQQRVEALLMMAQSSVVAGGGASQEHTLHILSDSRGDFLVALEKLLSTRAASQNNHGGVGWSVAEKRLLVQSLQQHQKDFRRIQERVKTKSLSQCVEFYYLWKKKVNLKTSPSVTVNIRLLQN